MKEQLHFSRRKTLLAVACVFFVATCGLGVVSSFATSLSLGAASGFAVLGIGCSSAACTPAVTGPFINNSNVTINGNEGIGFGGSISNMAPSTVNGDVVQFSAGQISGPGTVTGVVLTDPALMNQAFLDAMNLSTTVAGLTPTQTFASQPSVINGVSGLNVINITGNITSNLTLNGPPDAFFVINVSGTMTIGGSTTVGLLTGGVPVQNVLWNFTSTGQTLTSQVNNTVNGTLLALNDTFNFHGATGAIISNKNITLMSAAVVNQAPFVGFETPTVPEPGTLAMMGVGVIGLFGVFRRKQRPA